MTKSAALVRICVAYVLALYVGGAALYLADAGALIDALLADLVATVVIFVFSRSYRNSSFYDAYWSVVPPFLALYWLAAGGAAVQVPMRELLVLGLILYWATRLTLNWACHWTGINHEDWRYGMLKDRAHGKGLAIDFLGIHLFPTLQVFAGMLPVYAVYCLGNRPLGWLDLLACLVTGGAITLQMVADFQLHAFLKTRREGEQLATGLWALSRHPNYFGELGFWFGLLLFGIAAYPQGWAWQAAGAVLMTLMFLLASIPMMEKRSLARRPDYQQLIDSVPMLIPWPLKRQS